jgi:hypothetical protein
MVGLWSATTSTYICPLAGLQSTIIPALQIVALLLDTFLVIVVVEMSFPGYQTSLPQKLKGPTIWASVFIATAIVWLIVGVVIRLAVPDDLSERLPFNVIFSIAFVSSQLTQALSLSILYISIIASVSRIIVGGTWITDFSRSSTLDSIILQCRQPL